MILGIDTSLGTAVAVVEPTASCGRRSRAPTRAATPRLIGSLLEQALAEASVGPAEITHVAAGMGPGPFTGLRVGIAAARAFALGRGIPVIPVVSHDAVALELLLHAALTGGRDNASDEPFAVVTDARRREFAYSVYRGTDDDGLPMRIVGTRARAARRARRASSMPRARSAATPTASLPRCSRWPPAARWRPAA